MGFEGIGRSYKENLSDLSTFQKGMDGPIKVAYHRCNAGMQFLLLERSGPVIKNSSELPKNISMLLSLGLTSGNSDTVACPQDLSCVVFLKISLVDSDRFPIYVCLSLQ